MTFNGVHPHSVLVMDNCSIHCANSVVQMVYEVGALVHFLPPYSPDYNPIEEAFSKVKGQLKAMDIDYPEDFVMAAFATIAAENCQQWIRNAGIYNYM